MAIDIGPLQTGNRSIGPLQPSGTTNLTESLADSFTLSEALGLGFGDAFPDSITLSDNAVAVLGLGYSFSDSFTINDASFQVTLNLPEVVFDIFSLSDSAAYALAADPFIQFSVVDSFTVVDAAPAVYYDTPVFDNLDFEDSIQVALVGVRFISVSDVFVLADLIANTPIPIPINLFVSDTLLFAEYQIYDNYAFGDQFLLSDAILVWSGSLQQNDSFTILDVAPQVICGIVESLADSFSLGDSIVPLLTIPESVGDHVLFTDQVGFSIPISINPITQFPPSIDNILFTDTIQVYLGSSAFSDQVVFVDSPSLLLRDLFTLSEMIGFSDGVVVILSLAVTPLSVSVGDSLTLYDAYQLLLAQLTPPALVEGTEDSLVFSDSLQISLFAFDVEQLVDSFGFSEGLRLGLGLTLSDSVTLSDNVVDSLWSNFQAVNDGVVFSDAIVISGMAVQLTISVVDSVSMSDLIQEGGSVIPIAVDTSYIRRYLNDVLVKG